MLRATMSIVPSSSRGIRSAAVITRSSSLPVAGAKILSAMAVAMSMSKPLIWPSLGSREPSRNVSAATPATSLPRLRIRATASPPRTSPSGAYERTWEPSFVHDGPSSPPASTVAGSGLGTVVSS